MPWGRLDDQLHDNEKVESLTHQEFRLWILSISRCNRKRKEEPEGRVSQAMAETLCRQVGASTRRQIAALIEGMLRSRPPRSTSFWEPHPEGGYVIHDFPEYAHKADQTAAERKRAERDRRRLAVRDTEDGHAPVTRDTTVTVTRDAHMRAGGPSPVPRTPFPSTPDETASVIPASTADRLARVQTMARAVPKPGEPGAPDWPLYEAFAGALGCEVPTSPSAKRKWSEPIAELHRHGVTAVEVPGLVAAFDDRFDVECTPQAVANQLTVLRAPRRPKPAKNGRTPQAEPAGFAGIREAFADIAPTRALP